MLIVDGDPTRNNTPVDTRLELLDSTGATLVNVNGSGSTVSLDNANPPGLFETVPTFSSEGLLFRAPANGVYYARVTAAVTGASGVGEYLLSITRIVGMSNPNIHSVSQPVFTVMHVLSLA